jgi:flagellar hook-associated protein 2
MDSTSSTGSYATSTSKFNIGGIISGLDVDSTVKQLMDIEAHPLIDMQARKTKYETQMTAWKQLDANILALQSSASQLAQTGGFISKKSTSSDEDVLTATASTTAIEGTYSISVKSLAKTHQLQLSSPQSDYNVSTFGTGTLSLTVNGETTDISIDSTNNTIEGIASAINKSDAAVSASYMVLGNNQYQLVLTSNQTGLAGEINVSTTSGITLPSFTDLQAAADAKLWIGDDASHMEITRSSNTITDIFTGVTLNLTKVSDEGKYLELKTATDTEASQTTVNNFITNYNNLIDYFDKQFFYDGSTGEQGTLQGNATLIQIQNSINTILFGSGGSGALNNLAQIGIEADASGKLSIENMTKFNDAVKSNSKDLLSLFNDSNTGIATKLKTYLNDLTSADGAIASEEDLTQVEIDTMDDKMQEKTDYLGRVETRYRKQFTELETALATMKDQMNQISGTLSALLGTSS